VTRVGFRWLERGSCRHPEVMTITGGSLCAVDFPSLVGVIAHPTRGIFLFDTGYDPAFIEATKPFPERLYRWTTPVAVGEAQQWHEWLASHGIAENDIVGTVISHFHGDHVAGMRHLADKPIYCARAGLEELRRPGRMGQVRKECCRRWFRTVQMRTRSFLRMPLLCLCQAPFRPLPKAAI